MKKINILENKGAWIRIVEAFTMILLITGFLLVILNKEDLLEDKSSKSVYEKQQEIIRKIQLNNTLREDILNSSLPVEWDNFPSNLKEYIISETPSYLECKAKICSLNDNCVLNEKTSDEKNLYVQKSIISATLDTYSPRQINVFCWEK